MHIYEADIRAFFDRVSHEWLRKMLRQRVTDKTVLRLIDKWLQAGVMRDGLVSERGEGVPQGGPISPILSNIYLHYALDLWFEKKVKPALQGHAAIIRFADDFVVCFQYAADVKRFENVIQRRLGKFEITIAPEKTRCLLFGRFATERLSSSKQKVQEFTFLGFRHICGIGQDGRFALIRLPANDRLSRFRARVKLWLRQHNHWKVRDQQRKLSQMLQGLYAYYGITHCTGKLAGVQRYVMYMWRKRYCGEANVLNAKRTGVYCRGSLGLYCRCQNEFILGSRLKRRISLWGARCGKSARRVLRGLRGGDSLQLPSMASLPVANRV